jgi:MFS family permease
VIAQHYGLRPEPFYLGIGFSAAGLALSTLFVRDTSRFVALEARHHTDVPQASFRTMFAETSWRKPGLWGVSQAGFVNNLNDGLIWGIFPLFFASRGLGIQRIAVLAAVYPLIWGSLQLITGVMSDRLGRQPLIVAGMVLQGGAILLVTLGDGYALWVVAVGLIGIGTAMVYPTLLAAISDVVHPVQRSSALGVYRFWRDAGAIAGALVGGGLADAFGFSTAIRCVGVLTLVSGVVADRALRAGAASPGSEVVR